MLPQQLAGPSDVGVKVFLRLGALHGVHHQVHQLLLQDGAALLLLAEGKGSVKGGREIKQRGRGRRWMTELGGRETERKRERTQWDREIKSEINLYIINMLLQQFLQIDK